MALLDDFLEDPIGSIVNLGVNISSFGTVGYNSSDGLTTDDGFWKKAGDATYKGLKDVSGATAAEEANKQARLQFEEAKLQGLKDRQEAIASKNRDDLIASRLAGGSRTSPGNSKGSTKTSIYSKLGSDERDFLGL